MSDDFFIARQPILNQRQALVAYEILLNKKRNDSSLDDTEATMKILDNILNHIGIENVVGKNFAFIDCNEKLLKSDILYELNPEIFVFQIMESVVIDESIIDIVKGFKEKGYRIAIDKFTPTLEKTQRIVPILSCLDFIKIERPAVTLDEIGRVVKFFHTRNVKILVEKVETEREFEDCLLADCDFFQGYFFAKPDEVAAAKLDSNIVSILEIVRSIDKELDVHELENKFKLQPQLSVNLIKYLNSAAFAKRQEITSIKHAITLLGYGHLRRWLLILAYANKSNTASRQSPLLTGAIYRATFFESIAKSVNMDRNTTEKAYLMGLVSNLNALYKISLEAMLAQISLDIEINNALLHKKGKLGEILELDRHLETDDIDKTEELMDNLGISMQILTNCMLRSYEHSNKGFGDEE